MIATITPAQLKRLQVLYGQYQRHSLDAEATREGRIQWAAQIIRRPIGSFSDVTLDEARKLIDLLQRTLGVALPQRPRHRTRREAEKAGTEGRRDQKHAESTLVGDRDIRRIQAQMARLEWDQRRLEAFLASPRGPNDRRTQIRTLGDANRVYWALKRMVVRPAKPGEPVAPGEPVVPGEPLAPSKEVPF